MCVSTRVCVCACITMCVCACVYNHVCLSVFPPVILCMLCYVCRALCYSVYCAMMYAAIAADTVCACTQPRFMDGESLRWVVETGWASLLMNYEDMWVGGKQEQCS